MTHLNYSRNLAVRPHAGCFHLLFLLSGLLNVSATAQTFTTLHRFTDIEGAYPNGLILSEKTLYGTTTGGGWTGEAGNGEVFKINTDGTGFTNLHSFDGSPGDGANPLGPLIVSGSTVYGTAYGGGSSSNGTVFAVNTDGTGFRTLHSFTATTGSWPIFTNSDGAGPNGLTLAGDTLFGTANSGGSSGYGMVFKVNTDGTGFTNLHNFTGSDGANPASGLLFSSGTLYGVNGTLYAINADGTGFRSLHDFTDAYPTGLILSGDTLYGSTAYNRGIPGLPTSGITFIATVFKVSTNGDGFTNLLSFTGYSPEFYFSFSGLTLFGNTLFGASSFITYCLQCADSTVEYGEVFAVNTNGTGYTDLHSFTVYYSDSALFLGAGLILSDNTLYGTTGGTIFSISLRPQLSLTPSTGNFILTWPTNYAGFDYTGYTLQSTTNFGSSAIWTTHSPAPVVVNGQNTVTNPISGTQQFFRLKQ